METGKTGLEVIYTERYEACFGLYLQYGGRNLLAIERDMRALGFEDFHRRILYSRKERGIVKPGWIEKFGWRRFLDAAEHDSPPSKGGVAAPVFQGADGVVNRSRDRKVFENYGAAPPSRAVDHPAQKTGTPLPSLSEEGCPRFADGVVEGGESFEAWLKQVSPELTWNWKYQKYIYKYLKRVTDGTLKRLMIFMPPRHGKSELVTIRYAGWRLWNDPKMKIIVASYNQKLADRFSRSIRRLLSEEEDKQSAVAAAGGSFPSPKGIKLIAQGKAKGRHPGSRCQVCQLPEGEQPAACAIAPLQGAEVNDRSAPGVADPGLLNVSLSATETADPQRPAAQMRLQQPADYPQCTGGKAADRYYHPHGKAEPFRTPDGIAEEPDTFSAASRHNQPAIRNPKSAIERMFPKTRTINTASQWETALGGGVKAVGVGAGVTGFGGQLIVIDDPVKSRAEAESPTFRERLWDWYRNDLYTRLEPNAAVILIQTRWHQDDLAGRLLQEMQTGGDQWEVIDLPALSEPPASAGGQFDILTTTLTTADRSSPSGLPRRPDVASAPANWPPADAGGSDPLGRPVGAALCPDRFDEIKLADIQRQLGSYVFAALYQQHPTPAEGGIFKRAWFRNFVDKAPEGLKWKRGYDLAVSTKTTACYTASFRIALDEATGNLYIADGFRERIEYPDQKRFIIDRLMAERDTEHGIEKALHGQALIQELRRETRVFGRQLRGIEVTADKVTRALTWAPLAEEGKVILVRGPWNRAFLDELAQFPAGGHDDQIDAVSLAFSMLGKKNGRGMCTF